MDNKTSPALGTVPSPPSGAPPSIPANGSVAKPDPQRQLPTLPSGSGAGSIAAKSGSPAPNGKPRKDGLVPNSPEAAKADREKARLDKAAQRARNRAQAIPAPLPARGVAPVGAVPPVVNTGVALDVGAGPVLDDVGDPFIPWTAEMVTPAVLQSLLLLEDAEKMYVQGKLKAANIPPEMWDTLMSDCRWPDTTKQSLNSSSASVAAKVLNWLGISSKYKEVLTFCPSVIMFVLNRMKFYRRLDQIIKAANPTTTPAKP